MTMMTSDLGTMDVLGTNGLPYIKGSLSSSLNMGALDNLDKGIPFVGGVNSLPYDPILVGEMSASSQFIGDLNTHVILEGSCDINVEFDGYANSGPTTKMEMIF